MVDEKKSKRAKWTIAAIATVLVVAAIVVLVSLLTRQSYATPIGCGALISSVTLGNSSGLRGFFLHDCWDHFHNITGPRLLLFDDLSNDHRWSKGSSWNGRDDTRSENDGGAIFANQSVAYNYTYVVGDGKGNGNRSVTITFMNGEKFNVSPDNDMAFFISARLGLRVQSTFINLPSDLVLNDNGKVPAIQSLVDEDEVIRNFLRDTDPS
jgi:hypothetical protein